MLIAKYGLAVEVRLEIFQEIHMGSDCGRKLSWRCAVFRSVLNGEWARVIE